MDKPQSIQDASKTSADAPSSVSRFHQGIHYSEYLKQIHQVCKPTNYLEIGVDAGATLTFAQSRAVAIDPTFRLQGNPTGQRAATHFFQSKSDEFFAQHDLNDFLPGGVDFAFLDGMHLFEYLLRDFINTEKYSHKGTVVTLHDCYPVNAEIADRDKKFDRRTDMATKNWWAGDTWKLLPILRDFRSDLKITPLDCPPTGLVVVQRLDPGSNTLSAAYDTIFEKYQNMTLEDYQIDRFRNEFSTSDSRRVFEPDALKNFLAAKKDSRST